MNKNELIEYLNNYLNIGDFTDDTSKNGLQVDNNRQEIKKLGYAVDANSYIFDKAIKEGVDMIMSHHGMYRGFESVMTGLHYERTKKLLDNNIGLYACHLPLDAHEEVGNNIGLLKDFVNILCIQKGEYEIEKFGGYNGGHKIGFALRFKNQIHISNVVIPYAEKMGLIKKLYNFGHKEYINSICFVSGGGGGALGEAKKKGFDVFVVGEMAHYQMVEAKELGQSVLLGGHYETEKIGPKLLAHHINKKFDIEIVFLDEKY